MLEIFNGCDKDRFLVEKICLRRSDMQKGILWVSSGSCVTVTFSSGQRKDNKFHLSVAESIGKDIYMKNFLCFLAFGLYNISGLSAGFWYGGSIQKVGSYFHFISPISRSELTYSTNIQSNRRSIQNSQWNAHAPVAGLFWQPWYMTAQLTRTVYCTVHGLDILCHWAQF